MKNRLLAILAAALCVGGCSGSPSAPAPVSSGGTSTPPTVSGAAPATLVGAGDIADCGPGAASTAELLDSIPGTIFTTGDNAYPDGSPGDFERCYEPTWGRHRHRTRPSPGNHDYITARAAGYFGYFGANAGPPDAGYYSYTLGGWHVVALNSETDAGAGSAQERWLRADLAANPSRCTAVYWHRPVFSSGPHGDDGKMMDIWRTLYELDADVVIVGHDHLYERFAPQDTSGRLDQRRGIRQFVVGTGGGRIYPVHRAGANSEFTATVLGVLALTLEADRYQWRFVSVDGSFPDQGSATCH